MFKKIGESIRLLLVTAAGGYAIVRAGEAGIKKEFNKHKSNIGSQRSQDIDLIRNKLFAVASIVED
ncbi:MAG: hypothetical protein ABF619_05380 [Oenococcus oeni]